MICGLRLYFQWFETHPLEFSYFSLNLFLNYRYFLVVWFVYMFDVNVVVSLTLR